MNDLPISPEQSALPRLPISLGAPALTGAAFKVHTCCSECLHACAAHVRTSGVIIHILLLQVLSILDGTAISWPGVSQAMSDLTDLVDLCMRRTAEQETATANMEGKVQGLEDKIAALTHNLAGNTW